MADDHTPAPSPPTTVVEDALEITGPSRPLAQRSAEPPPGQLGTFAVLGAAIGTVPLPWLPDALARRVRGALVQDIAARHGLSLSRGAREVLADPAGGRTKRNAVTAALRYLSRKLLVRFGPLALLPPLRAGLETYVLGHLFARFLTHPPRAAGGRIEAEEALVLRDAIERAVIRVASPDMELEWPRAPLAPEDSRDELTQVLDGLLSATATVPSWLLSRLDTAFDDALKTT
jgi:hypothetical protein